MNKGQDNDIANDKAMLDWLEYNHGGLNGFMIKFLKEWDECPINKLPPNLRRSIEQAMRE